LWKLVQLLLVLGRRFVSERNPKRVVAVVRSRVRGLPTRGPRLDTLAATLLEAERARVQEGHRLEERARQHPRDPDRRRGARAQARGAPRAARRRA